MLCRFKNNIIDKMKKATCASILLPIPVAQEHVQLSILCTDDRECHLGTATIGVAAEVGSGLLGTWTFFR